MLSALSCEGGGHGSTHAWSPVLVQAVVCCFRCPNCRSLQTLDYALFFLVWLYNPKCFLLLFLLVFRVGGKNTLCKPLQFWSWNIVCKEQASVHDPWTKAHIFQACNSCKSLLESRELSRADFSLWFWDEGVWNFVWGLLQSYLCHS